MSLPELPFWFLRHGETDYNARGLSQGAIDIPLNDNGRAQAKAAGSLLAGKGIVSIVCSPMLRTRETAIIVAAELDVAADLQFEPALYLGEAAELLPPLQRCPDSAQTVLMVGHNPGLSVLAQQFMGGKQRIEMRPAGLCRIDFEHLAWRQLRPEAAVSFAVLR